MKKLVNEVKIGGFINFCKEIQLKDKKMTTFNLSVYAGKSKKGNEYVGIKVVYFGDLKLENKKFYVVEGNLKGNIFNNKKTLQIVSENIHEGEEVEPTKQEDSEFVDTFDDSNINDDIPF